MCCAHMIAAKNVRIIRPVLQGAQMRLGLWWLDAAVRGAVDQLPLVNSNPVFEGQEVAQGRGRGSRRGSGAQGER